MHRRRILLAGAAGLSGLFGGCSTPSFTGKRTPQYDCSNASRPRPPSSTTDGGPSIGVVAYPQRPDSLDNTTALIDYVKQYEMAYRQNLLYKKYGEDLLDVGVSVNEEWTHDTHPESAIVRFRYVYSFEYEGGDETIVHGDSPVTYVSYYVDDSVVIRAADNSEREDESALDPDPLETGSPVECF